MAQEVIALQQSRRLAESLNAMKSLWHATQLCNTKAHRNFLSAAWNAWAAFFSHALAQTCDKGWRAEAHCAQWSLGTALSAWRLVVVQTAAVYKQISTLT